MLPTLSRLSVSSCMDDCLRLWCSSRSLRISPLHREFHHPPQNSSLAVSNAELRLSRSISLSTCKAAYTPFTPSKSEQRLPPTYYRGCWHVISRGLFNRYRHQSGFPLPTLFFPIKRGLQPEGLLPSRGVAPSGFPPLWNILGCCLP